MNIFTTENVAKYNTKNATEGIGEYVLRNGVWAMCIKPAPFYGNYEAGKGVLLKSEFEPNTQYIFDLWIDGDDTIYQSEYRRCGFRIHYTDGTNTDDGTVVGGSGVGFQHTKFVTNSSKSVDRIEVYYYTNLPAYYRADSYITPLANTSTILKSGIVQTGEFSEAQSASIGKGYINAPDFIEI